MHNPKEMHFFSSTTKLTGKPGSPIIPNVESNVQTFVSIDEFKSYKDSLLEKTFYVSINVGSKKNVWKYEISHQRKYCDKNQT